MDPLCVAGICLVHLDPIVASAAEREVSWGHLLKEIARAEGPVGLAQRFLRHIWTPRQKDELEQLAVRGTIGIRGCNRHEGRG